MQKDQESIEQYVVELKLLAKGCNFETLESSLIRDQIVVGVPHTKLRRTLLAEENFTLERAIKLCQADETMKTRLKSWEGDSSEKKVEAMKLQKRTPKEESETQKSSHRNAAKGQTPRYGKGEKGFKVIDKCFRCWYKHAYNQCPAFGKECYLCKGKNHFAKACKKGKSVHTVETLEDTDSEDDCEFLINAVEQRQKHEASKDWIVTVQMVKQKVPFKIDTGAQTNIIPMDIFERLKPRPEIKQDKVTLTAYGGHPVETFGTITVKVTVKLAEVVTKMVLVAKGEQPILGLKTCEDLGLVKRIYQVMIEAENEIGNSSREEKNEIENPSRGETKTIPNESEIQDGKNNGGDNKLRKEMMERFPTIFKGIGCLKTSCTITLKDTAQPVIIPPRRVPFAIRDRLKDELARLVNQGIIRQIEEPTSWVSPLVIIEKKKNRLRLCLDPKALNENIRREHYQIPTKEEIQAELAGAAYFSKLDAASGFYQIPLEEESQTLTTFNTPFGRYCFRRLPFGIASAPEIFFKAFSQVFDSAEGTKPLHDDVIVWGTTAKEHDERLIEALTRAKDSGVTLNPDKCVFRAASVAYMGEIISKEGVRPDPSRVAAVIHMPKPQCKADVQRALGVVNFMGKYIPNLSGNTQHMRSFLKKDIDATWKPEHDLEWQYIKDTLTKEPVLTFFDPESAHKISTDASNSGLGAVLLQQRENEWYPVAYASRALTDAETRYAQIEKEALGLVFGCYKFHNYVYGKKIILETDHKPLLAMTKRVLAEVPPRLQRLFLRLMRYHYTLTFKPGKDLVIADALSRASLPRGTETDDNDELHEEIEIHVNAVVQSLPVGHDMMSRLREETRKDLVLTKLKQQIRSGWSSCDKTTSAFAPVRSELTEVDGLVLKGSRIVVPSILRSKILDIVHDGHLGIEKCRRRARQAVYWPNMNSDVEHKSKTCSTCNIFQHAQQHEPLMMRNTPNNPWERVGTDLFHYGVKDYLVLIDAYSNYLEVEQVTSLSASAVIKTLKRMFARHGIPKEVLSDNVPFNSEEFAEFANQYEFKSIMSSPKYPRSNGLAEKGVQIGKRLLKKAAVAKEDFELGLLSYRNTPLDCGKSPAQLLMGRSIRTRLPELHRVEINRYMPTKHKQSQKGKGLSVLKGGEVVRIRHEGEWRKKAQVIKEVAPRSFLVKSEDGIVMRRNRHQLLSTREHMEQNVKDQQQRSSESKATTEKNEKVQQRTRSQRTVRAPIKLNL